MEGEGGGESGEGRQGGEGEWRRKRGGGVPEGKGCF